MRLFLGSLTITLLSYFKIINGFFQQDEWFGYSEYILRRGFGFDGLLKYFFAPSVVHYTPFTLMTLYSTLSIFGMNYTAHSIISLTLHVVVVILLFNLFKKIFNSKFLAGIGTLLFASFSSGQQATSWVMADIGTHCATIFGILSIIFFLDFLKLKSNNKLYYSFLFLFISLFFKEITLGLFAIMLFLIWSGGNFKKKEKIFLIKKIMLCGSAYVLLRLYMIFLTFRLNSYAELVFESQSYAKWLYDFITIPIKAVSQSIVPIEIMRGLAEFVARLFPQKISNEVGSPAFELFVVKRVMEAVSLVISFMIAFWVLIKKNRSSISTLGLIWIIINSFIFAFSPLRNGITSVIDSRNLYFVSIGAVLIITTVFSQIRKNNYYISLIFLLIILIPNLFFLNRNLDNFVKLGTLRRNILNNITTILPDIPSKVVIFTQSNQSYYGLPIETKIMPFQSGFGQTLLAWYYPKVNFPKEFFINRFLWEIDSQGYKEVGDVGFGYYRDLDLLIKTVKQYNLPNESVIAFSWDGNKNMLRDISEEIRVKIHD
ncbi:MAG: hypothetical protein WC758_07155 [Candidatus Woesearchaeota archaeon]|jgi:hypothetical protein